MPVTITHEDVADLCTGSVFLATGGGGDPYISQILVQDAALQFMLRHGKDEDLKILAEKIRKCI